MVSVLFAFAAWFYAAGSPATSATSWEEIFSGTAPDGTVTAVWATGPNDWFVSGKWGVARSSKSGIERTPIKGRGILGLFGERPDSVFAFGYDERVLHFDGKRWNQEHVDLQPRRSGRGADLLYSAFYLGTTANASIAAFGTSLLLVRQPDATWIFPPDKDRERLWDLGQGGRSDIDIPAKCDRAGWFWLGKNRGFFDCHDGRAFIFDGTTVMPKGKLPKACRKSFDSLTTGRGEIYASCSGGTMWKTDDQRWLPISPPKRLKDIPGISVTDECIFVAAEQSIWRNCAR